MLWCCKPAQGHSQRRQRCCDDHTRQEDAQVALGQLRSGYVPTDPARPGQQRRRRRPRRARKRRQAAKRTRDLAVARRSTSCGPAGGGVVITGAGKLKFFKAPSCAPFRRRYLDKCHHPIAKKSIGQQGVALRGVVRADFRCARLIMSHTCNSTHCWVCGFSLCQTDNEPRATGWSLCVRPQ